MVQIWLLGNAWQVDVTVRLLTITKRPWFWWDIHLLSLATPFHPFFIQTGFIIWLLSLWISLWVGCRQLYRFLVANLLGWFITLTSDKALLYLAWEKWAKTRNDMDSGWSVKKAMKMPKFLYLISPVLGTGHAAIKWLRHDYVISRINWKVMTENVKDQINS